MRKVLVAAAAAVGLVAGLASPACADTGADGPVEPVAAVAAPAVATFGYKPGTGAWQVQSLAVLGTAGSYTLRYRDAVTAPIAATAWACRPAGTSGWCTADSLQYALNRIGANVTVSDGPDGIAPAPLTRYTIRFVDPAATPLLVQPPPDGTAATVDTQCVFCLDTEVTPPANANGGVVVYVHGGGFVAGDRANAAWVAARTRFEDAGYRTFSIDYRLMNGSAEFYGPSGLGPVCDWSAPPPSGPCRSWRAAADSASADLNAAVAWVRGQAASIGVDADRVAVLGSSAGAIAALNNHYLPVTPEGRQAATVSLSGIMDPNRQRGPAGPVLLFEFGGIDPVYAGSALEGIDAEAHDEEIVAQAQRLGNKAYLRTYPGAGHDIAPSSPYYEDAMRTTLAFLDEQLRPAPPATTLGGLWHGTDTSFAVGRGQSLGTVGGAPGAARRLVGDFNGDGRSDLVWQDPDVGPSAIWFGGADGVLHDPVDWGAGAATPLPSGITGSARGVVGDVDGDGIDDIVWYDPAAGTTVEVWRGQAAGAFAVTTVGPFPGGLRLTVADVDGDHRADLVVDWPASGTVALWRWDGTTFAASAEPSVAAGSAAPVTGDFNGDGRDDVFWPGSSATPLWLASPPGGTGAAAAALNPTAATTEAATHQGRVADLNGDGIDDVVWYDPATGLDTTVWYGSTSGAFSAASLGTVLPGLEWYVGDANGDHQADLIVASPALHGALLLQGGPTWRLAFVSADVPTGADASIGDFDGDGRTDVLWAG